MDIKTSVKAKYPGIANEEHMVCLCAPKKGYK